MLAYTKDELISSTDIVRNFSAILDSIKDHRRDKVAVMRKNKLEAVILSIDEYERIQELADLIEHLQIYKTIEERKVTPVEAYVDFEQLLAENGLSINDI
jgi:PHD/YefM family antitoxin component YafN of YafNO toxin-antitoxin module